MEVVYKKVDEYVDSLAPQIQPRIATEIEVFQKKTIDSLESQVIDAFHSLFDKGQSGQGSRDMDNAAPDTYGGQSLPFADEIANLTRSFTKLSDEASDDLRDIFDLTEGRDGGPGEAPSRGFQAGGEGGGGGARKFLTQAIGAVQDHLHENRQGSAGGNNIQLDGLLGIISNTVKDASRNPEEKARLISPEIKEKVGAKLREQHSSIAEQFTRIALEHIKRWLRGNTSSRDLGDGAKAEVEEHVKDIVKGIGSLFGKHGHNDVESSRGMDNRASGVDTGESGGFSKIISDKLSTGLAKVHREVRLEFRKILGAIEKQLFELLPDQFQKPLEKILGGNPFDSELDRNAGSQRERGFGDDIKTKLVIKLRDLIRKVQETLRKNILGVVNGGHRKFERESWVFVQDIVEKKVQRYLPNVKISVPDDIGNEGVSVGEPAAGTQLGSSISDIPSGPTSGYNQPPQSQYQEHRPNQQQQAYQDPPPQGYHGSVPQSFDNQQYPAPLQQYGSNAPYHQTYSQGYERQTQSYSQNQGSQQPPSQSYHQAHDNQHGEHHQSRTGYGQHQSYYQDQQDRPGEGNGHGQGPRY